jgi:transcriptional regulator with XRE-family HTH domain
MPLGTRIRKAREQTHVSQAELARRIGISKQAMNAIEGGATDPRASRIVAIAQVLGVSTDALLLGTAATGKRQHKLPALRTRPRTAAPVGQIGPHEMHTLDVTATPILRAYACYQCANVVWLVYGPARGVKA